MIIRAPRSLEANAKRDLENFIRDIANVTQRGIRPFIRRKRTIRECVKDFQNPFDPWTKTFDKDFICKDTFRRYMHIDLGQNRDAVGIAMAHVPFFVEREIWKENPDDKDKLNVVKVQMPVVKIDFWGRITVRKGEDIILGEIRELVYELSRRHFYFGLISLDRFQSLDSIQILRSYGYRAAHQSIDRTAHYLVMDDNELGFSKKTTEGNYNAAQFTLREIIYDNRLWVPNSSKVGYDYDYFQEELFSAQEVPKTGKIDHPPGGTLDVEQAVCGSAFHCINNERMYALTDNEKKYSEYQDSFYNNEIERVDKSLLTYNMDLSPSMDPRDILTDRY